MFIFAIKYKKMKENEKIKILTSKYGIKLGALSKQLQISRYMLNKRIKDNEFKEYQQTIINELYERITKPISIN